MTPTPARILVVDDEKLIRWSVSERLQRDGYQVISAESGEQALELIAATPPDVMLLDVKLPGIDGVQTLRQALALHPELAVLMMSAHSTVDVAVEAMKHGAIDFLVKPFPLTALDAAVARALSTSRTRRHIAVLSADRRQPSALDAIVGGSVAMGQLRTVVGRLAGSDTTTVLIEGESGSGKEVVARVIHFESARRERPILQVNCAALPEHLLESELFGHERGAFTDAHTQKRGLFETADGGAVMLDEIGDLPPGGQAKLLRLLENKTFRRVGGVTELHADVRVIAATNVDLEERVSEGRFRADLFFRLNVVRLVVPPLREHRDDVPVLARPLHRPLQPGAEAAGAGRLAPGHGAPAHLPLARQRARAAQRHRARLHPPRRRRRDPAGAPDARAAQGGAGQAQRAAHAAGRGAGAGARRRRAAAHRRGHGACQREPVQGGPAAGRVARHAPLPAQEARHGVAGDVL